MVDSYSQLNQITPAIDGTAASVKNLKSQMIDLKGQELSQNETLQQLHDQVTAASDALKEQELVIKEMTDALEPYKQAMDDANQSVKDAKDAVDDLKASLDAAKRSLSDLTSTPVAGTRAFEDQISALDVQAAAVQAKIDQLKLSMPGSHTTKVDNKLAKADASQSSADYSNEISAIDAQIAAARAGGASKSDIAALEAQKAAIQASKPAKVGSAAPSADDQQMAALQDQLDQIRTQKDLLTQQHDITTIPEQRKIKDLTAKPEMPFDAIVKGIEAAKTQIGELTPKLDAAQATLQTQQDKLKAATDAYHQHKAAVDATKASLDNLRQTLLQNQQAYQAEQQQIQKLKDQYQQASLAVQGLDLAKGGKGKGAKMTEAEKIAANMPGGIPGAGGENPLAALGVDPATQQGVADMRQKINDMTKAIEDDKARVDAAMKGMGDGISAPINAVMPLLDGFRDWFDSEALPPLENFANQVADYFNGTIKSGIDQFVTWAQPKVQEFSDWLVNSVLPVIEDWADRFVRFVESIYDRVLPILQNLQDGITTIFDAIKGFIERHGDDILKLLTDSWHGIERAVDDATAMIADTIQIFLDLVSGNWGDAWQKIVDLGKHFLLLLWDVVDTSLHELADGINLIWDGVADATGHLWSRITQHFESGVQSVVNILNGMIGAVNGILSVLSVPNIPLIGAVASNTTDLGETNLPPAMATGGVTSGPTIVGEEPGHAEFVIPTNPAYRDNAIGLWLQAGQNLGIAGFAQGGIIGTITSAASSVAGAISDPVGAVMSLLNAVGFGNVGSLFTDLGEGVVNLIKNGIGGFIGKNAAPPGGPVSGDVVSWLQQAIALTGVPLSWLHGLEVIAYHESGGDPHAINNWDINAQEGHPSKGLMQMIDGTFQAHELPGHGDIWNPVDNAASAIEYILAEYGDISNVPGVAATASGGSYVGYADGGILPEDIYGVGPSGTRYQLHGGETVVPRGGSARQQGHQEMHHQPIHLHVNVNGEERIEAIYEYVIDQMGRGLMRQMVG